jgi:MFS family permease
MTPSVFSSSDPSRRTLRALCVASAGWAFSFGLGAPLASLWLHTAGCDAKVVGLNTSVYYLGVAIASLLVPRLMARGGKVCVLAGMVADGLSTALFPWGGNLTGWFALRLVGGIGTALSLIPMETLVNHNAAPDRRARDFGFYALSVALGVGLGSVAGLSLYILSPHVAFVAGGLVTLAAAGVIVRNWPADRTLVEEASGDAPLSLTPNLLSFGTAWVQGFLEGSMLTFLSIYLLTLGFSETGVSGLMGGLFLGVVLFQVPLAWLADRLGRLRVLLICHAILLTGLLWVPVCSGATGLGVWLFLLGGCCGALYPLGLALLGERAGTPALAKANAWYLACNCAGSLSGPVLIGLVIDLLGQRAQFIAGAAALVLVVAAGLTRYQTNPASRRASAAEGVVSRPAA